MFFFFFFDKSETDDKFSGNKGEWGELYTFFKILTEGKIYAADANYNKLQNIFLSVLNIIREEVKGSVYQYTPGDNIVIKLNGREVCSLPRKDFITCMTLIWNKISTTKGEASFTVDGIGEFLDKICITKLKSPANQVSDFFGGTVDIVIEVKNSDNVVRTLGFSCKSEISSGATLFNASGDNTNFVYEVTGIDDNVMNGFNNLFKKVTRKGKIEYDIATRDRMEYLKAAGGDLVFSHTAKKLANDNLVRCCGIETPAIIAGMVKHFYYDNLGGHTTMMDCIKSVTEENVAKYEFDDLENAYYIRVSTFLYNSFTGLRLGTKWDGRAKANGGYIVLKRDGEVVAYHSTIIDEFKDFLVHSLIMEGPSHKRHKDMVIEKIDGKYYLKLALQLRFSLKRNQS